MGFLTPTDRSKDLASLTVVDIRSAFERFQIVSKLPPPQFPKHVLENFFAWKDMPISEVSGVSDVLHVIPNLPRPGKVMAFPAYYRIPRLGPLATGLGELTRRVDDRLQASPFVFARPEVIRRLDVAQEILDSSPEWRHLQLVVVDGFRDMHTQAAFFRAYKNWLAHRSEAAGWSEERLDQEAQKMISKPVIDRQTLATRPPHHNTGGAVDLVMVRKELVKPLESGWIHQALIEFGSEFDEMMHPQFGGERSNRDFFEESPSLARDHRRVLQALMSVVGFTGYPYEWFHFQYGTQLDAYIKGETAAQFGSVADFALRLDRKCCLEIAPSYARILLQQGSREDEAIRLTWEDLGLERFIPQVPVRFEEIPEPRWT